VNIDRRAPWWGEIVTALSDALDGCPPETLDLFDALFSSVPVWTGAEHVARHCGVTVRGTWSRFQRDGLPTPALLADRARLVRLAYVYDDPRVSITGGAMLVGFDWHEDAGRWLRRMTGQSPREWRQGTSGPQELARFVADCITGRDWQSARVVGPAVPPFALCRRAAAA
jgi:hypothetical protein